MVSHTYNPNTKINCTTDESSIETVNTLCDEISLTSNIANEIQPALDAIKATKASAANQTQQLEFATMFSENLPENVQAIICAPYGC